MSQVIERLRVQVTGQGPRTLVFGNGFGTEQTIWAPIVQDLARDHRVVTFDPAGSPLTMESWQRSRHTRLEGYAEDLLEVIEATGGQPVSYVGHSFGGMTGVLAANAEPGLFKDLVLIGASARYLNAPEDGYEGGMVSAQVDQVTQAMRTDYAAWVNGFSQVFMGNAHQPGLAAVFAASLRLLRPDVALAVIEMILRSDRRSDCAAYGGLGLRTLLLQTRQDAAVPQAAALWLARQLGAQYEELDLEGHFPHLLDPARVTRHLRAFLGQA